MKKTLFLISMVAASLLIGGSVAQTSTRTLLDLRTGPIINSGSVANLALIVPSGASTAYPEPVALGNDRIYVEKYKYIGYHKSESCYTYIGTSDDGYFAPSGSTDSDYHCNKSGTGKGWSGNFLNWANTAVSDVFRLALTGGDRYIDETNKTVLQRAILPSSEGPSAWKRGTTSFDDTVPYKELNKGVDYRYWSHRWDKGVISNHQNSEYLTPFGNSWVVVKACDDKIFFGNGMDYDNCKNPGVAANLSFTKPDGTGQVTGIFKARVLVCDETEGPNRLDLCEKQASGYYKPVGEIQKNSEKVRVAVFGYLNDSEGWVTPAEYAAAPDEAAKIKLYGKGEGERYGGVLRAPMKFTGPNLRTSSGSIFENPESEWNATTGVFNKKPINTSTEADYSVSGVVNYINRLGRLTRDDGVGLDVYSRRESVGEMYYEMIRYFQGQQPTAKAVSDLNSIKIAGYPVYSNWVDPMQTGCQKNYVFLMGADNTSKDAEIPGSTITLQNLPRAEDTLTVDGKSVTLNADTWTRVISSFEINGSTKYKDSQGVERIANGNALTGVTGQQANVPPYNILWTYLRGGDSDGDFGDYSSYLYAGVAYWANTQSIRPDKPLARVKTFVLDQNWGIGYPTRKRALYLAAKYGGFSDVGSDQSSTTGDGNPFKTYVNGALESSDKEWLSADGSTYPNSYFLPTEPAKIIQAVQKVFSQASFPTGNFAGGSLSVSRLSKAQQSGAFYQAKIDTTDWFGSVVRTALTYNTTTLKLESNPIPVWDAANILTGVQSGTTTFSPFPLPENRNIVSFSASRKKGISFSWDEIDSDIKNSLKIRPSTKLSESDDVGKARLNYIRGVRSGETDELLSFRARRLIMGDSINSAPVLKGKPNTDILDSSYRSFFTSNASRTPTVYIGSNDGMLHAFRAAESESVASNGQEIFAYVPRAISLKLNKLTDSSYSKDAYVDGAIAVNEAQIYQSETSSINWGTALVAGMGGGAKGLFALNVTKPESFTKKDVLWEFTDSDDSDMGHLLGEPKIVKLSMNGGSVLKSDYKWFAMVTSGYNNYSASGGVDDKQALFLLSLEKAPGEAWSLGVNYFKIYADNSSFTKKSKDATGMAMPGVATGINGNVLFAYAGDLQGNLWKFDLSGESSKWMTKANDNSSTNSTASSDAARVLFIAKIGDVFQPITTIPAVTLSVVGGYQIGFGTGKFMEPSDGLAETVAQQSIYSIWDSNDGQVFERGLSQSKKINGLISRKLTTKEGSTTLSMTGDPFSYGVSVKDGSNQYRGWYADFSGKMERVAVDPVVDSGLMAVNSSIPGGDLCSGIGSSNQYRYNPATGFDFETSGSQNTQGYLGSASLLEVGDTLWTPRNSRGRYLVTRKINSISPGVGGGLNTQESTVTSIAGRISWREIANFQ